MSRLFPIFIFLCNTEFLGEIVNLGKANRLDSIVEAEKIIERGVVEFYKTLEKRAVVPIIKSIQDIGEQYQKIELEKANRRLANGDDPMLVLSHMAIALANKFMHAPIHALKQSSDANLEEYKQIISKIYSPK